MSTTTKKRLRISEKVLSLWLSGMILYLLIFASSGMTDGCVVLSVILMTSIMIAAMYGAVMLDMDIDHVRVFRAIQFFVGILAASIITALLVHNGSIETLSTIGGLLTAFVVFACVEFIVIIGSNAFMAAAWCMADIHKI